MRSGFKWLIALLLLSILVLTVGVPLFGMIFGGGFDP